MNKNILFLITVILLTVISCTTKPKQEPVISRGTGTVSQPLPVALREWGNIEVWLPPGNHTAQKYRVLDIYDGHNVFNHETLFTRTDWGTDERLDTLVSTSRVKPAIIVGIWNTKLRFNEYMPDECITPEELKEVQGYLVVSPHSQRNTCGLLWKR